MIHSPLRSVFEPTRSNSCEIKKLISRAVASSQRHRTGTFGRDAFLVGIAGRNPASRSDLALCLGDVRRRTRRTVNEPFLAPAYEVSHGNMRKHETSTY